MISKQDIDAVATKVNSLTQEQTMEMADSLRITQPAVFAYLTGVGKEIFTQAESEWFLYLGVVLWQSFLTGRDKLPAVTPEMLDRRAAKALDMVRYMKDGDSKEMTDALSGMLKDYPQPHLLAFIVAALRIGQEEGGKVQQDNASMLFFFLKILIDSFHEVCPEASSAPKAEEAK